METKIVLLTVVVVVLAAGAAFVFLQSGQNQQATVKTKVVVIGAPSAKMTELLSSPDVAMDVDVIGTYRDAEVTREKLSKADVVLMQGEEYCDNAIELLMHNGIIEGEPVNLDIKRVVAIGNACSRAHYSQYIGMEAIRMDKPGAEAENVKPLALSGKPLEKRALDTNFVLSNLNFDPPLQFVKNFKYAGDAYIFDGVSKIFVSAYFVDEKPSSQDAMNLNFDKGKPAVVLLGNTIYLAFDPSENAEIGTVRNLFLDAISIYSVPLPPSDSNA